MKRYWPDDADGDVLRQLDARGFDFDATYGIDFNVDFESWPPAAKFVDDLRNHYRIVELHEPDIDSPGYVLFVVRAKLSYELLTFVQESISALAEPYGGICESWGIQH